MASNNGANEAGEMVEEEAEVEPEKPLAKAQKSANVASECPAGLIELRNALKRELQDEADAYSRYREASTKLRHYGMKTLADKVKEVAMEEFAHRYLIGAVVDAITLECELEPEEIKLSGKMIEIPVERKA